MKIIRWLSSKIGVQSDKVLHFLVCFVITFVLYANDTSLISIGGIINVTSANTEVDVRVAHDNGGSVNITCVHCNLNLVYISE